MGRQSLSELKWRSNFLGETPGDEQVGGQPRQNPGVCWSRVEPTRVPNPVLRMWSEEMAETLNLEQGDGQVLGGNRLVEGMDPYAQRYGGHQFGNWANQLGDGRAITLGEVDTGPDVLELQLKGPGKTPYSRFADGKAVLRSSIREYLCSELCTISEFQQRGLYPWSRQEKMLFEMSCTTEIQHRSKVQLFVELPRVFFGLVPSRFIR